MKQIEFEQPGGLDERLTTAVTVDTVDAILILSGKLDVARCDALRWREAHATSFAVAQKLARENAKLQVKIGIVEAENRRLKGAK